jgi:outer membrane translocation and assembly module TamA
MIVTPVGPARVDFAYQLRPNPFREIDIEKENVFLHRRWAIHLSLGSSF